jgi:hypothetical protein
METKKQVNPTHDGDDVDEKRRSIYVVWITFL